MKIEINISKKHLSDITNLLDQCLEYQTDEFFELFDLDKSTLIAISRLYTQLIKVEIGDKTN